MDSAVDMLTEQSLRTLIEDVLNEITESAIEKAHKAIEENIETNETDENTVVDEVKVIEKEFEIEETDIDSVVEIVIEKLIVSVCQSPTGGGDASEDSPAPTLVVVDTIDTETKSLDRAKGDCAEKAVTNQVSQPAKGAEIRNTLGDLVGWLDAGAILAAQELAPRKRQRRLAAPWRGIKRFFLCGCCVPRGE